MHRSQHLNDTKKRINVEAFIRKKYKFEMTKNVSIFKIALFSILCTAFIFTGHSFAEDNTKYVNPFIGTAGEGHTFPGAVVPWGMVQLSPDTNMANYRKGFDWCAGYRYEDKSILGFSHTHFSGTGHSDLGDLLIMPTTGPLKLESGDKNNTGSGYRSAYSHDQESAEPGYYSVLLKDYNIKAELTSTMRTGFHRYTFNEGGEANVIIDLIHSIHNHKNKVLQTHLRHVDEKTLSGYRRTHGWAKDRHLFFVIRFSKPIEKFGYRKYDESTYGYRKSDRIVEGVPEVNGKKIRAFVKFKTENGEQLIIKVGISAVSPEGAMKNLLAEADDKSFDTVRKDAKELWKKELRKFSLKAPQKEKEIFFTALYHLMIAPSVYMDTDRKYRGLDNNIHKAEDFTNYTTFSLWDTYRATHPLFTLIERERTNDFVKSMMAHQKQNAWKMLPVWSFHNNENWCMIGYHSVPVIADAFINNIKGFDTEKALKAMVQTAETGKYDGLAEYMKVGYVPIDKSNEGASKTLEYAYDDWTIAQMAKSMGKTDIYNRYMKRAGFYKNVFDKKTKFMRARLSNGKWRTPFDPLYSKYGGDYTEGNAWQYTWYVPHDVEGLIRLMGGRRAFLKKLDKLFTIEAKDAKYHEVEDISGLIGQYAHGNEPSQHIAYLYSYAAKPWKTQEKINQIMNGLFNNTPDGICGNEDCGQMSAWYIFSSMGFYPVCPGSGEYVFGKPSIPEVTMNLENGRKFRVVTKNLSDKNIYIQKIKLNGKTITRNFIRHSEIMNGGELIYTMGPKPNKRRGTRKKDLPYSMSLKR